MMRRRCRSMVLGGFSSISLYMECSPIPFIYPTKTCPPLLVHMSWARDNKKNYEGIYRYLQEIQNGMMTPAAYPSHVWPPSSIQIPPLLLSTPVSLLQSHTIYANRQ